MNDFEYLLIFPNSAQIKENNKELEEKQRDKWRERDREIRRKPLEWYRTVYPGDLQSHGNTATAILQQAFVILNLNFSVFEEIWTNMPIYTIIEYNGNILNSNWEITGKMMIKTKDTNYFYEHKCRNRQPEHFKKKLFHQTPRHSMV